ncbi:MAG: NAD(P)H-dependent oxidoreductase [Candidatus Nanoarchaeia archaeon]|nr:NAD(P)H-dependent oxidoreductase [Candidatus Nanoarchaeia archaeon]
MKWKCAVCGYVHDGNKPPVECPQCSSDANEFIEYSNIKKLEYDGKKYEVLLVNGSNHKSHNTGIMAELCEKELKKRKLNVKRVDLNMLNIQHCWCCYSMRDNACTYPCRNQFDDAPALHEYLLNSRAIVIATPINWNSMTARLKDFMDRLTSIQNQSLLGKEPLCAGKIAGIMVNGHEDGALKTATDIHLYLEEMGFVLAPFTFLYRTHNAIHDTKEDNAYFKNDRKLKTDIENFSNNIAEMVKLDIEKKLKGKIKGVCE